jgi:hypothetical protein
MTVAELIAHLSQFPPDMPVVYAVEYEGKPCLEALDDYEVRVVPHHIAANAHRIYPDDAPAYLVVGP